MGRLRYTLFIAAAVLLLSSCGRTGVTDTAPATDAGADAVVDATIDAGPDATVDAGPDATIDAGPDATIDAGPDATIPMELSCGNGIDDDEDGDIDCADTDCELGSCGGRVRVSGWNLGRNPVHRRQRQRRRWLARLW